ncbi:MAG: hypothetical protein JW771_06715 [Candidatus Thermoplasmatota archaeon]|nr:hypothetical protein [Candidatus Thermoplasmatota archaeon]
MRCGSKITNRLFLLFKEKYGGEETTVGTKPAIKMEKECYAFYNKVALQISIDVVGRLL